MHLGEEIQRDQCVLHWALGEPQQEMRGSLATSTPNMALLQQRVAGFQAL